MRTKTCRACGKAMGEDAPYCPSCGQPSGFVQGTQMVGLVIAGVFIVGVLWVMYG